MRILIAPDKYKGTLTASQAAEAIARGLKKVDPDLDLEVVPLADGGEGTSSLLAKVFGASPIQTEVCGPLGEPVLAEWFYNSRQSLAVMEMASAAGLFLLPPELRNPAQTTTYGVGELLLAAKKVGAKRVLIGLGGSATCDGGAGMGAALGHQCLSRGNLLGRPVGRDLLRIDTIRPADLDLPEITALVDVDNPLLGKDGAARVFAPQKGADPETVEFLEKGMWNWLHRLEAAGFDPQPNALGAGAAGGLGFGLQVLAGAQLQLGIDFLLKELEIERKLEYCDLVITGEGRLDRQTRRGKVISGIARRASHYEIPVIAICGEVAVNKEQLGRIGLTWAASYHDQGYKKERKLENAAPQLSAWISKIWPDIKRQFGFSP